jgi:hypothetical protein
VTAGRRLNTLSCPQPFMFLVGCRDSVVTVEKFAIGQLVDHISADKRADLYDHTRVTPVANLAFS